jgi:hypothetical protein
VFTISLHSKDTNLLNKINKFFGVGKITIRKRDGAVYYTVNSIKELKDIIIPHFEKYPLLTQKRVDFENFKQIVNIMFNKEHLTLEGLQTVINLKSSMNKGSTPILLKHFPNLKPSKLFQYNLQENIKLNCN